MESNAPTLRSRVNYIVRTRGRDYAIASVPGEFEISAHYFVEHLNGASMVFEQIIVKPHDMPDTVTLDKKLELIDHAQNAALANPLTVEIAHAAERALCPAATV
jgi:hypothetical protein